MGCLDEFLADIAFQKKMQRIEDRYKYFILNKAFFNYEKHRRLKPVVFWQRIRSNPFKKQLRCVNAKMLK